MPCNRYYLVKQDFLCTIFVHKKSFLFATDYPEKRIIMKEVYQQGKRELYEKYGGEQGITDAKSDELLREYGENVLEEKENKSIFAVFISQFADLLVIILIVAAFISMLSGNVESTIVIFAVIVLNAILGTVQHVKAEKSLQSLKQLSAPCAKVLRNGIVKEVQSRHVVPGDILLPEAGDMIVADGRVIESYSLQVNESSLTGESANIDKKDIDIQEDAALGDRVNMVYMGSLVTYGRGKILVTGTGMNTEMGKIAALMNDTKEKKTPLQIALDNFSRKLAAIIMIICVLVFGLRLWQGEPVFDSLMFAVALAVAAIPEALGSIVTIVQAVGTTKMADDNAIIKELKAVESLGCVSVICSDKTGTLTQNKMTVKEIYVDGRCITPDKMELSSEVSRNILNNAILNNDSSIDEGIYIGDPTEISLLNMAYKTGVNYKIIRSVYSRTEELPFDSDRKLMSSKCMVNEKMTIFTKGAVDVLLDRVDSILTERGVRNITDEDKKNIQLQNRIFSENGLRVLAFAYREPTENEPLTIDSEYGYTFTGLVSMMDPPREESEGAVKEAVKAGIKPIMITGDHKVTATAIAKEVGIYKSGDIALTGQEIDRMSDEELDNTLEKVSVYARVSPENKIRIVDAWQRKGNIVAMTGDGVNDAPALKKADIGVAMGITGTEVSKDAAAMILADDNFATIIKAVLNGRNVYRNIMNAILFLLSGNMAAILVVLYCTVMALNAPFEPVHLLFINLLTDSLPALAIGMEPSDKKLLNDKPRNPKESILTHTFMLKIVIYGVLIAIVTQAAFYIGLNEGKDTAVTMAFATLTLARLFHGFTCRSDYSIFRIGITTNKWSIAAFVIGVLLLSIVLFVPAMYSMFEVVALNRSYVTGIVLLAFIPTAIIQIFRIIKR